MEILVYGTGCPRCHATLDVMKAAAAALAPEAEVRLVTDLAAIMAAGVLGMPGIAIDGTVVSTGHVPGPVEARLMISERLAR